MARLTGSSFPEQCIYYYIHNYFPDALNRSKITGIDGKTKVEADVYIPSIKVAVEYDGQYWHQHKTDADNHKSTFFSVNDIFLIRIRAANLPAISNPNGIVLVHGIGENNGLHLHEIITYILRFIGSKCNESDVRQNLHTYNLSYEQYISQLPSVIANIYCRPCENNVCSIKEACVYTCWDQERNRNANPEYIPHNVNSKLWFKCPSGYSFRGHPSTNRNNKNNCDQNCSVCAYSICPFISQCIPLSPGFSHGYYLPNASVCHTVYDFFMKYLHGDVSWPSKYSSQLLYYIMHSNSSLYSNFLHMLVSSEIPQEEKDRIKYMFETTDRGTEDGYARPVSELESNLHIEPTPTIIRIPNVTTSTDLEFCKALIVETQWVVLFSFAAFDTEEGRKQAYDYLSWLVDYYETRPDRIRFYMSHFSAPTLIAAGSLSDDFYEYLSSVFTKRGYSALRNISSQSQ